ncbi:MAG: hypothetical protein MJ240_00275 [Kiritimatiellae bacterium]|nr:hypothetical protein [Kiritimatiellia bacterium]
MIRRNCLRASLLVLGACVGGASLQATEFIWTGKAGDGDWTNPTNWQFRNAAGDHGSPQAGDSIWVSVNYPMTLDASNAANLAVLNSVDSVNIAESTSYFTITVPSATEATISVPVWGGYGASGRGDPLRGNLTVQGGGTLHLTATGMYDYCMKNLTLDGACVWLPQNPDLVLTLYSLGSITVTNGATLHLPTCHDGQKNNGGNYVNIAALYGDGTVTASEATEVRFTSAGGVFAGVLDKNIGLFSGGRQYLTGENSSMAGKAAPLVYNAKLQWSTGMGLLGVKKFGYDASELSSIGKGASFAANVNGATYLYLGEGETTTKYYNIYPANNGYDVLDAGTYGGLQFVTNGGVWVSTTSKVSANNSIVGLNGSNTTVSVFRGRYLEDAANSNLLTTVKKGTGTWRFADPALDGLSVVTYRKFRGTISVDEGVLQFDTLAPRGEYCSVGLATQLKGPVLGTWRDLPDVDWAFSLGGTNAALKALAEGTLEYTGTSAALCDDRRVRLEADGRFRANGPKHIRYRLAESTSARAKTLSLDGASTATNEVSDLVDSAAYPVSLVKEGTGSWCLGNNSDIHGDLTVKGGTLIVRQQDVGANYTWFRFTVKDLFDSPLGIAKGNLSMRFLGFYDVTGRDQTLNLPASEDGFAASLQPGQCAYGTTRRHAKGSYSQVPHDDNVTNLFHAATVYDANMRNLEGSSSGYYPRLDVPASHVPFVVRLTNGAPAIASYDWATTYGWTSGNKGGFHWMPCRWSLEGSVDGLHWEDLNPEGGDYVITTNDCPAVARDGRYVHTDTAYSAASANVHSGGWPIRGTSTNAFACLSHVQSLRVDAGASLVLDGPALTVSRLRIDPSQGVGTIAGVTFAETGLVELASSVTEAKTLPCDWSATSGTENLSGWSVKADGRIQARCRVKYADGALVILPPGLTLSFR